MGKARDLKQIRKVFGLGIDQNLLNELGSKLRQPESTDLTSDLFGSNPQRLGRFKELVYLRVIHGNVQNACSAETLDHLVLGRNIVSKLIKLQNRIVQIRESVVSCINIGIGIVRGMLNGSKIVNGILLRHNDNSSGVLSRGLFNSNDGADHVIDLGKTHFQLVFLEVLCNVSVCSLIGKGAQRSRTENVFFTEKLLGVFMHSSLHLAREVKVDIRGFIAIETKEGLERNVVTVAYQLGSALGAVSVGQVETRAYATVGEEL